MAGFPSSDSNRVRKTDENSQEDCLPFFLDDDSNGPEGSPSYLKKYSMKATYGFSLDTKIDRREASSLDTNVDRLEATPTTSNDIDAIFRYNPASHKENNSIRLDSHKPSVRDLNDPFKYMGQKPVNAHSRGAKNLSCSFLISVMVYIQK